MTEDLKKRAIPSRRAVLQSGVGLGIGVWLTAVAGRAIGEPSKISQAAAGYVVNGKTPGEICSRCKYYTPAYPSQQSTSCLLVEGPINPRGHCRAFSSDMVN